MITVKDISLLAAFLLLTAAPAGAQDPHHPTAAAPQMQGAMPQGGGMGGMMGGAMPMVSRDGMMGGMMMGGMMPMMGMSRHVEGWLAFLRTELKIGDAQSAAWNQFADAVRANAASMHADHAPMMPPPDSTLPARLAAQEQMVAARLQMLQRFGQAVAPLYAALSDEQKKLADELLAPHGMM